MTRLRAIGLVGLGALLGATAMAGGQRLVAQGAQGAQKAPRRFVVAGNNEVVGPASLQFYTDSKTGECYLASYGLDGGMSSITPVTKDSCTVK